MVFPMLPSQINDIHGTQVARDLIDIYRARTPERSERFVEWHAGVREGEQGSGCSLCERAKLFISRGMQDPRFIWGTIGAMRVILPGTPGPL